MSIVFAIHCHLQNYEDLIDDDTPQCVTIADKDVPNNGMNLHVNILRSLAILSAK